MAIIASALVGCGGCWNAIVFVETGIARILDEEGDFLVDESGNYIYPENGTEDMKISEYPEWTDPLPQGAAVVMAIEGSTYKYLLGGRSLATYIDVITDGSDSINDPRITQDIVAVLYGQQSDYIDFSVLGSTITSPVFTDLGAGRTIRIIFGTEIPT